MVKRLANKVAILIGLCLAGCQHTPLPDNGNWRSGQNQPLALADSIAQWQYKARVSVRSETLNEQANLSWNFADAAHEINLFGPLGIGATRLVYNQQAAVLSDAKGIIHQSRDAQSLMADVIGWPLPVYALSDWLFARPVGGQAYQYQLDEQGNLLRLKQSGWQIEFGNYRFHGEHLLPGKIFAQRTVPDIGLVKVRVATKRWSFQ